MTVLMNTRGVLHKDLSQERAFPALNNGGSDVQHFLILIIIIIIIIIIAIIIIL